MFSEGLSDGVAPAMAKTIARRCSSVAFLELSSPFAGIFSMDSTLCGWGEQDDTICESFITVNNIIRFHSRLRVHCVVDGRRLTSRNDGTVKY